VAERVVLHIGAPKTGTTFVQDVMWANRPALRKQGVLLPGERRFDHFHATLAVRNSPRLATMPQTAQTAWDRIVSASEDWPGTVVISHEFFSAASAAQARDALARLGTDRTHLVLTARDYVKMVPALWQESVKTGSTTRFEDFVTSLVDRTSKGPLGWRTTDLQRVLTRWTATLPAEQVHIVTVPPSGAPPDELWRRYAGVVGIDPSSCRLPARGSNESLGVVEVEVLRRVLPSLRAPLTSPGPEQYKWIRLTLAQDILVGRGGRRFGLRPDEARIMRQLAEDAVAMIEERGFAVAGDTGDLVSADVAAALPHPSEVTEQQIADAAAATIAELVHRLRAASADSGPAD
jgi:hypothetical protein